MDIPARYAEMARGTRAFAALNAARESDRMSHAYLLASPDDLLSVCVAVCILDITLPMMFRFGVEKGRLAMFLIIFLVCASAGGIATIEQSSLDGGFYLSLSLVPAAIAAVVLTVVSIPLAIRFYGRRSR